MIHVFNMSILLGGWEIVTYLWKFLYSVFANLCFLIELSKGPFSLFPYSSPLSPTTLMKQCSSCPNPQIFLATHCSFQRYIITLVALGQEDPHNVTGKERSRFRGEGTGPKR